MSYIALRDLAGLAGVSRRALEKALGKIVAGKATTWRAASLIVRRTRGRGGASGLRYEVRIDSLPIALQDRLKERAIAERPVLQITDRRSARKEWLHLILSPALAQPPRSPERRAEVAAILNRPLTDWQGRPIQLSERSLLRWLQRYEARGVAAFAPGVRADKGHAKCLISLKVEQSIPFDDETWERIATDLRNYIRCHWKAGATLKLIQGHANIKLRELIEAAGFDYCDTLPADTFIVPRRFIERERIYRHVYTLHHDRKRYEDNRFRTQRTRAGMQPMDWVIGDVHPLDIIIERGDRSTAHARMIAWLDCATNRLRFDLVLCEPGTGIRNADLVQSFCHMLADPAWGMPKTLYIDNGREYRFADDINEALQLVAQLRGGDDGRRVRVVHARPYNAAAKPIESMFAALERMLQDVPGHTGGDRLNKKTERVGRPTKAFPGDLEQLTTVIRGRIALNETMAMRGALAGRSPRQAYEAAIAAGWQPVAVDPAEILTVFATDRVCTINKGVIAFDGRRWHCDELAHYHERKIIARVPRFWRAERMALLHVGTRALVGIAEPVGAFAFDDPAGARRSQQIDQAKRAAIRMLDRSAPAIDTVNETLRIAAAIPPAAIAVPIARVGLSRDAAEIAARLNETPAAREDRQRQKNIQAQRRQSIALDNALRALKRD